MKRACFALFITLLSAGAGPAAAERHTIMKFTPEQLEQFSRAYNRAPRVYLDPALKARKSSVNLLPYLKYTPAERDQGACGNCWQWAGTGCMEISHTVQNGVKDRLSVQYLNSCAFSVIVKPCCDGGWLDDVATFYALNRFAIPWSNPNAYWQDGDASCDTDCASIATTPRYEISSSIAETIPTQGVIGGMENIMNVLDQNKPVFFAFFLANEADWDAFFDFWDNKTEPYSFDFSSYCGHPTDGGFGGHAVLCVGYDYDPEELGASTWVMLNSWGTNPNRPNGLFRVPMDLNYDCMDGDLYHSLYFQSLNITFSGTAPTPTPTKPPTTVGAIRVNTTPVPGAAIFLDYFDMAQVTNSTLAMVSPGLHTVAVSHPLYPPQAPKTNVQVVPGAMTTVNFQLLDISQSGDLQVQSEPEKGAAIYLDFRDTGEVTDATLYDIAPGTHFVSIRKDGTVPPGVETVLIESGLTTPILFELWASTGFCPIDVSSTPPGAEIYLDYITTGLVTNDSIAEVGYGTHEVTVRKSGYLIPPPQIVELSAGTCGTSLVFQLLLPPTPTPTPTPRPTPFPEGLRVLLNNRELRPGDTFTVSVSFTDTILDWDGYMGILRSDGKVWSIVPGGALVEGIHPIVGHAMEIHQPFGPVEVLNMQIPHGVGGFYGIYAAILPLGTVPTIQNARGHYSQFVVEPARVMW